MSGITPATINPVSYSVQVLSTLEIPFDNPVPTLFNTESWFNTNICDSINGKLSEATDEPFFSISYTYGATDNKVIVAPTSYLQEGSYTNKEVTFNFPSYTGIAPVTAAFSVEITPC